jgi:hypothetical protein
MVKVIPTARTTTSDTSSQTRTFQIFLMVRDSPIRGTDVLSHACDELCGVRLFRDVRCCMPGARNKTSET